MPLKWGALVRPSRITGIPGAIGGICIGGGTGAPPVTGLVLRTMPFPTGPPALVPAVPAVPGFWGWVLRKGAPVAGAALAGWELFNIQGCERTTFSSTRPTPSTWKKEPAHVKKKQKPTTKLLRPISKLKEKQLNRIQSKSSKLANFMDPLSHLKLHEAHDSDLSRCSCLAGPQKTSPLHQPNPGALHPLSLNSVENAKFLEGNHLPQAPFNHHSTTHLSKAPPRQHCRNSISRATRSAFFRCVAGSFCGSMVVEYWERSSCRANSPIWPLKNGSFQNSGSLRWSQKKLLQMWSNKPSQSYYHKAIFGNLGWHMLKLLRYSWALNVDTYPKSSALALNWSHSPQFTRMSIGMSHLSSSAGVPNLAKTAPACLQQPGNQPQGEARQVHNLTIFCESWWLIKMLCTATKKTVVMIVIIIVIIKAIIT